jgi:23S rRNA (cytidine2498-2'-O)-methyltransferase
MAAMLATCQPGYEKHLVRELATPGAIVREQGAGWVSCDNRSAGEPDLVFAHWLLPAAQELRASAVNALAQQGVDFFTQALADERLESAWPCVWRGAGGVSGLSRRVAAVERAFHVLLRRRLARVARLAAPEPPVGAGAVRGLFVYFTGFDRAWAAREAVLGGQRRMADDPAAPSRSYLKIEEAYGVLGAEPRPGDLVVDLGAAPGGWSYSAAKRGARVVAVDNGPLKAGAHGHPLITHRRQDAFGFRPEPGGRVDWLLCDLVEEPHQVLQQLVTPWLGQRWCRRFVINLKFGRADPMALLGELRARSSPLVASAAAFRIRHLYHDREEFTVVGSL